jgi:UDP-N-acetylglucosamine acyltransferase
MKSVIQFDPSNKIDVTAIIGDSVFMGKNNVIGPYCVIEGNTIIGDGNHFMGHCSIGTPAEDYHDRGVVENYGVEIGDGNVMREFCTINAGTLRNTQIGSGVKLLRGTYVGHDVHIEDDVILSCNVLIGGFTRICKGANLGLGAIVHQKMIIGAYSFLGMGCVVTKKSICLPGNIYIGSPCRLLRQNTIGLDRAGISHEDLDKMTKEFNNLQNENAN